MSSDKMHSLLKRQLRRSFGDSFEAPEEWRYFIDMVNNAYYESDMDRNMLERSLEMSSQELLQANSEMRAIFEALPDIFFRVDASGTILDCKTGNTSDLFISRQEMIGNKIYDIPLAPVADKFRKALEDVRRIGQPVSIEYSLLLRKIENYYEARFIPLLENQFIIVIRNVTDRKKAESALQQSEEYYREITTNSSDVLFIVNEKGVISYVSPSVKRYTGHSPHELIGLNGLTLIAPEDYHKATGDFQKALATQDVSIPHRFRIRHKNGSEIIMEGTGKNLLHNPVIAGFVMNVRDVTDRRRAEKELLDNEAKLQAIFDRIDTGVLIIDRETQIIKEANRKAVEMAGLSREQIVGQICHELVCPALKGKCPVKDLGQIIDQSERKLLHADGSQKDILKTVNLIVIKDREYYLESFIDISDRKQAEEDLQESEQKYRLLASYYERLNDISLVFAEATDTEDLYKKIAESLRLLTGAIAATFSSYEPKTRSLKLASLSIDPVSGDQVSPFFGPALFEMRMPVSANDLSSMLTEGVRRPRDLHELSFGVVPREVSDTVMQAFGCREIVALALSHAGEVQGTCVAYLSENQRVVPDDALKTFSYLSGMAVNRKHAEETVRKSEERYRTIFESTATANIIVAEDATILMANDNFARLCGYTKQELEGKISWPTFIHPDDLERMKNYHVLRRRDSGSAPSSYEFRAVNRKGDILSLFVTVAIIPQTKVSVISMIDLTGRKQLETQLVQAQKMESVGRLAGGVAHDFNNMLSVIIGNTEMAMGRVKRTDSLYQSLHDILSAGMRSAELTRQLLAFARKQTVSPKVMDLNDTVTGMLKMLQRLIGENIDLGWHPGHNLWKVKIDPSQIDQLLANLTVNARDAIEKTGRITIETSNITCDDDYCADRPEWIPGDYVLLAVSDNGCGMERGTLANVFEPFFTTKKEGQGTGLGLATVYGIVKQNYGFIHVYSELGSGTTFKVYLPRYTDDDLDEADAKAEADAHRGSETVLLVEDEEAVLKLSTAMLESLGYAVLAARNKDQALRQAAEYQGHIDLLLTDVVMPGMNGKELSERILAVRPEIKCLYMSGYTADVIARQGVLDEGVKFISKPFSLRALAAKLREALDS